MPTDKRKHLNFFLIFIIVHKISAIEPLDVLNVAKISENTIVHETVNNINNKLNNQITEHKYADADFTTISYQIPLVDEDYADLMITKIKEKDSIVSIDSDEFLSKLNGTTEISTISTITSTKDEWESTYQSSTENITTTTVPQTDKPPMEESVVANYTLCEDMLYEDLKEETSLSGKSDVTIARLPLIISPDKNFTLEDLVIKQSNESSLTVAWKPKDGYDIQWYIIKWYTVKGNNLVAACRTNNETFNYTITHLYSCTTYEVHVLPATNETLGHHKLVIDSTALIVDKDSLKLRVAESGANWIKISWNLPNSDCIDKNIIDYCNFIECKSLEVSVTSYNVTSLIPCTDYNFTLTIKRKNGESGSTDVSGSTEFMKPGEPSPAWTEAGNNSLKIYWTAPIGATCVITYKVTIERYSGPREIITKNTTETSITFDRLKSCSTYDVVIFPVDKQDNDSLPARLNSNRTLAPTPEAPKFYKFDSCNSRSIKISWGLLINEFNNCEDIQITAQCNFTKVLGHGYIGINGTTSIIIPKNTYEAKFHTEISNLSPFTEYDCYSIASNIRGNSSNSQTKHIQTQEDVPSSPLLTVHNIRDKQFDLSWNLPEYLPGNLITFEVNFTWYYKFHQPSWCGNLSYITENITGLAGNLTSLNYNRATPFSVYKATIRAKTAAGWGNYSEDTEFTTWPGAPGPVSNLTFVLFKNPFDSNILDAFLTWGLPCFIHGPKIDQFNITGVGHRKHFEYHNFTEFMVVTPGTCNNDTCTRRLPLKDEHSYVFDVAGRVKDSKELGSVSSVSASFPAGIPPEPPENYTNLITIDPLKARRTTTTASILLPLFPNTNGDIKCYAVIVAKAGYNNGSFSRISTSPEAWQDMAPWYESMQAGFTIPYQATKFCDNTYPSYIVDYGRLRAVKLIIGDDMETCRVLSTSKTERSYCNGALNPDEWYDVRMRAFTSGGYRDSKIFIVKTNAEIRVHVVIGSVVGVLLLGILATMMLLIRRCSFQALLRQFLHSDMPASPVPAPFTRRKFIIHCQQLADNPGKLSNEFQLLQTLSLDLQMPNNTACLQVNRKKNRYTDILPYDFSRVKLEVIDSDPNTDYINASFIKGFGGDEEYIACQGPKEETTYDFWRMIDKYDIKIIIMLTQLVEKNKEKCHQYYPTIRETFTYENLSIRCTSELDYRTYIHRTLVLQKDNQRRNIIQLHFKDWPDHDVPEDYDPMINFCQIMRRHILANRGIAVIHCSAGIGRTGTLIAIDILLQHIKENRKLDVFGTVYRLRHHRINMVQRESQYAYIYNCIRQVLKNPYFSKTYKPPSVDPITDNNLNNKKKDTSMTNLVSSLETLKKDSLSSSIQSAEEILKSSTSITLSSSSPSLLTTTTNNKLKNCLLSIKGHHYSKSTSAIYSSCKDNKIIRYNTLNYPVNKINIKNPNEQSSSTSTDGSSSDNLNIQNFPVLSRYFKSTTGVNDDRAVTHKLLDTSL